MDPFSSVVSLALLCSGSAWALQQSSSDQVESSAQTMRCSRLNTKSPKPSNQLPIRWAPRQSSGGNRIAETLQISLPSTLNDVVGLFRGSNVRLNIFGSIQLTLMKLPLSDR
ncbi:hypothetical protein V8C43DRAFT_269136 [Trichoderma afarasin]